MQLNTVQFNCDGRGSDYSHIATAKLFLLICTNVRVTSFLQLSVDDDNSVLSFSAVALIAK